MENAQLLSKARAAIRKAISKAKKGSVFYVGTDDEVLRILLTPTISIVDRSLTCLAHLFPWVMERYSKSFTKNYALDHINGSVKIKDLPKVDLELTRLAAYGIFCFTYLTCQETPALMIEVHKRLKAITLFTSKCPSIKFIHRVFISIAGDYWDEMNEEQGYIALEGALGDIFCISKDGSFDATLREEEYVTSRQLQDQHKVSSTARGFFIQIKLMAVGHMNSMFRKTERIASYIKKELLKRNNKALLKEFSHFERVSHKYRNKPFRNFQQFPIEADMYHNFPIILLIGQYYEHKHMACYFTHEKYAFYRIKAMVIEEGKTNLDPIAEHIGKTVLQAPTHEDYANWIRNASLLEAQWIFNRLAKITPVQRTEALKLIEADPEPCLWLRNKNFRETAEKLAHQIAHVAKRAKPAIARHRHKIDVEMERLETSEEKDALLQGFLNWSLDVQRPLTDKNWLLDYLEAESEKRPSEVREEFPDALAKCYQKIVAGYKME